MWPFGNSNDKLSKEVIKHAIAPLKRGYEVTTGNQLPIESAKDPYIIGYISGTAMFFAGFLTNGNALKDLEARGYVALRSLLYCFPQLEGQAGQVISDYTKTDAFKKGLYCAENVIMLGTGLGKLDMFKDDPEVQKAVAIVQQSEDLEAGIPLEASISAHLQFIYFYNYLDKNF